MVLPKIRNLEDLRKLKEEAKDLTSARSGRNQPIKQDAVDRGPLRQANPRILCTFKDRQ